MASTIGAAHSEVAGLMTSYLSIRLISIHLNSRAFGSARYSAEWTEFNPGISSVRCFAALIRPRWPSHASVKASSIRINFCRYCEKLPHKLTPSFRSVFVLIDCDDWSILGRFICLVQLFFGLQRTAVTILPAPLERGTGLFSLLSFLMINGGVATPVANTMCYGNWRGVLEKIQMRIRNTFVFADQLCLLRHEVLSSLILVKPVQAEIVRKPTK